MKKTNPHSISDKMRKVFVLFCTMWIVLSSCSLQASITHLITSEGSQHEQIIKLNKAKTAIQTNVDTQDCQYDASANEQLLLKANHWDLSNPYVALLVSVFSIFFLGYRLQLDNLTHPLYQNSSKLHSRLPIFIQHRNFRL